jgi:hypothetical protein
VILGVGAVNWQWKMDNWQLFGILIRDGLGEGQFSFFLILQQFTLLMHVWSTDISGSSKIVR